MLNRLLKLDLSGNNIGKSGALALGRALAGTCRLVHFSLAGNKLGDFVLGKIFTAIQSGKGVDTLLKLDIKGNIITCSAGFMDGLSTLKALCVLDMSYNAINLEAKKLRHQFINMLARLSKLQVLSIAYNRIHDTGCAALLEGLEYHNDLLTLDLSHCFFTRKSVPILKAFLEKSKV